MTSVRELSDGRVLVTDPQGKQLVAVDFSTDRVEPVGRMGRGPGEFSRAMPLIPLAGDSSLMADVTNRRWLLLDGARVVATLPPEAPIVRTGHFLSGADRNGRVLYDQSESPKSGVTLQDHRDSSYLVVADRRTGHADTVARLSLQTMRMEREVDASGRIVRSSAKSGSPLTVKEQGRLLLDGWIVIVRRDPYRVEWRRPDGHWIRGPLLPYEKVRVTRSEKEATMRYLAERSGNKPGNPDFFDEWPAYYPPCTSGLHIVVATPDGSVLIRRARTAKSPEARYDLVDRQGVLRARYAIAANAEIIGCGRNSVYVVTIDEDGLRWLAKHPWP